MHPQVQIFTPKFNGSAHGVLVDEGLKDIILDIWDLEGPDGHCRTIYSCQGEEIAPGWIRGYIMFESGFEASVTQILSFYGKRVTHMTEIWNSVWPRGVWTSVSFRDREFPTGESQ